MAQRRWTAWCLSVILLMVSVTSASADDERSAPGEKIADNSSPEQIQKIIQYGEEHVEDEAFAEEQTKEEARERQAIKLSDNEMEDPSSTVNSTGAIYVKFEKGWKFNKKDHVTQVSKDEVVNYPDALYYLDYEFPEATIEPLWGDPAALARLKERGEKLSGQSLPDLSLWYKVVPDPMLPVKAMIGTDEMAHYRLSDWDAQLLARALRILRAIPGVRDVHAAHPMVRSSFPTSTWVEANPNFLPYQYQTAPDVYLTDGDYGEHDLAPDFPSAMNFSCDTTAGTCPIGGLNIWPAWDKGFFGGTVPVGYVEEDWCLGPLAGQNYPVTCPTHPALANAHANRIKYLTSDRRYTYFGYPHGTSVFGIMAADHNNSNGGVGMAGIAPASDYYIGQVWDPAQWINIVEQLVATPNANGAVFLLEAAVTCFPGGGVETCPPEVFPEVYDFVRTVTANNIVVVEIPGNGLANFDNPLFVTLQVDGDDDDEVPEIDKENYELIEFDMDDDVELADYEFVYPDGDAEWGIVSPSPKKLVQLDRSFNNDSGAILVTAGLPNDASFGKRRTRMSWGGFGSRVDLQARGAFNIAPAAANADSKGVYPTCNYTLGNHWIPNLPPYNFPNLGYGFFPGTSSCGPTVAASAALAQEMYKAVRTDALSSIRMRNALVENGNPQIPLAQDPNRTSNAIGTTLPEYFEAPNEPFARIGPRPDLGRVMYAFGVEDGRTAPKIRYHLPFDDHQKINGWMSTWVNGRLVLHPVLHYKPSEPFANNYARQVNWDWGTGGISHTRSPRIAGGFAVKLTPPASNPRSSQRYLQLQADSANPNDIFHPHRGTYGTNNFTLSAWILLNGSTGSDQYIIYKGTDTLTSLEYALYVDSGMHLCAAIGTTGGRQQLCTSAALTSKALYQVAAVVRNTVGPATTISLFIDSIHSVSQVFSYTGISRVTQLPDIGYNFKGTIDDVLFEDYALNISNNICADLQSRFIADSNPAALISSWHFDIKNVTAIADPVFGYSGTLNTATDFYSAWGAGVPVGSFNGTHTITVADTSNPSIPPLRLNTLGASDGFSIEAHFKIPDFSNAERFIVARGRSDAPAWALSWVDGHARFVVENTSGTVYSVNSDVIPSGQSVNRWVHVLAVFYERRVLFGNGSGNRYMSIYTDGIQQTAASPLVTGSPATPNYPVTIGSTSTGNSSTNWNTPMEYVHLYDYPLTTLAFSLVPPRDEVFFLYNNRASLWKNSYYKR